MGGSQGLLYKTSYSPLSVHIVLLNSVLTCKITVTSVGQGLVPRLYFVFTLTVFIPLPYKKAIENGEKSIIKGWLLNEDAKANEYRGGRAFPRHHAVANGTALHWAVYYGQLEITQLLLDNGAGTICNLVPLHGTSAISIGTNHKIFLFFFCLWTSRFIITVQSIT